MRQTVSLLIRTYKKGTKKCLFGADERDAKQAHAVLRSVYSAGIEMSIKIHSNIAERPSTKVEVTRELFPRAL